MPNNARLRQIAELLFQDPASRRTVGEWADIVATSEKLSGAWSARLCINAAGLDCAAFHVGELAYEPDNAGFNEGKRHDPSGYADDGTRVDPMGRARGGRGYG